MYVPLSTMNKRISKIERLQSNKPQLRTKKLLTSAPKTTQATNHQHKKLDFNKSQNNHARNANTRRQEETQRKSTHDSLVVCSISLLCTAPLSLG
jgi:hypothetical protein